MHYRRSHPKRTRSAFSYTDRHRLAIDRARALRSERAELLDDLCLLDHRAAPLDLNLLPPIIC